MKLATFQASASQNTSNSIEGPIRGTGVQMFHKKIQSVHGVCISGLSWAMDQPGKVRVHTVEARLGLLNEGTI